MEVIFGLGGNIGDRVKALESAQTELQASGFEILACSPLYETTPLGPAKTSFINAAARAHSNLSLPEILSITQKIEQKLGRKKTIRWGDRIIDIDILAACGDGKALKFENEALRIPHPELLNRDFALVPAAEVAPEWCLPDSPYTLSELVAKKNFSLNALE